jgi:hypothetical protein
MLSLRESGSKLKRLQISVTISSGIGSSGSQLQHRHMRHEGHTSAQRSTSNSAKGHKRGAGLTYSLYTIVGGKAMVTCSSSHL